MATKYGDRLAILGFPCGQFENQEPGSNSEILNSLFYVRPGNGFKPAFTLFQKGHVNGDPQPVYQYLRGSCSVMPQQNLMDDVSLISWTPVTGSDISWNFEKFLIDRSGKPFRRYNYMVFPDAMIPDIEYLLSH